MKLSTLSTIVTLAASVAANKLSIDESYRQVCAGMYDKQTFGGSVNPFIATNLLDVDSASDIAVVVWEYQDIDILGMPLGDGNRKYVCDSDAVDLNMCDENQLGTFIVDSANLGQNKSQILTYSLKDTGVADAVYPVKNTGYYCVAVYSSDSSARYDILVNFRNSFGNIAAAEFPKLALYAALAIAYAVTFAYYAFNFWKHKHEILPLQKYFMAFFVFLTIESVLIWSFYDLTNRKGSRDAGVTVYMVFISILNSIKFTFSFFLLLVISLGYGIVYPKLDRKVMRRCQIFAAIHLVCSLFFIICNYLSTPEQYNMLAGISVIPVMITTGTFYVLTLKSLSETTGLLAAQKQIIKLQMYRYLFRIIFFSLLILVFGIIVSSFIFIGMSTTELIEQHWKSRFFFLDFWPTLVYYVIFNMIAFIWRPTDTSYMLAASSQLPTDPENAADFELDDLQSLQEDDGYQNLNNDNDSLNLDSDGEDLDNYSGPTENENENESNKKNH